MQSRIRNKQFALPKLKTVAVLAALTLITGCATTTNVQQIDQLETVRETPRIVLMPPDIRYYLITASGIPEPHAEWTAAAEENFAVAIKEYADSIGTDLKMIDESNMSPLENRYEELHAAVGMTVIANHFGFLDGREARWNDTCIVEYEQIAGTQQQRQFVKFAIDDWLTDLEQTAGTPLARGVFGDQRVRQRVVEIGYLHQKVGSNRTF